MVMNPYTGEVLALVSTPSYDTNAFILGLSGEQWATWNEDEDKPLYNRFRQIWSSGLDISSLLQLRSVWKQERSIRRRIMGSEGLRWQKDTSWGSYYVTTLHAYEPVILENALIYSDNIYFAKAALKIGV